MFGEWFEMAYMNNELLKRGCHVVARSEATKQPPIKSYASTKSSCFLSKLAFATRTANSSPSWNFL